MKNFIHFLVCLLLSGLTSAQSGKISGKITDSDQKPLDAVLISLLSATDNSLQKTTFSEADGSFIFSNLPDNQYLILIDSDGFETYQSQPVAIARNATDLPPIVLSAASRKLDEVVIVKKKSFVENKIDRTVVNVDALMSAAGSDAMDVLEKSPGISIDQNGVITFKGKSGVAVFIDDKPTYLSGADLEAYLKSLPASTLNQIEFMTNPPAKYDAAGSAGVINIKTKKSRQKGFNGSFSSRVSKGKRGRGQNSLNLNYTDGRIRLYGNAGFSAGDALTDLYIFRRYKNPDGRTKTLFDQNSVLTGKNNSANVRVGMDYYLSEKTTLGISVNGFSSSAKNISDVRSVLTNAESVLDSTIVADNKEDKKFKNGGITFNYSRDLSEGKKLTADADFLTYSDKTAQLYRNYVYQPDGSLSSSDRSTGNLPSKISIYAFKTDYSQPFKGEASFETGYKVSYSKTDNIADYADIINGVPVPNLKNSNHFKYDEVIHAAYANFNKSFKRFSLQTGLRLENTMSKGNQLGNDTPNSASRFTRSYTNLFPTVYLMYKLDSIGDNQLVTSYGKRINRPYYQDLNPFLSPLDKFTFYSGNPYLNPSFSHNVELSYRYKGIFSTTLSYGKSKDDINETIEIKDEIYYSRPGNIGRSEYFSLNVQSDFEVAKWFSTSLYTEATHSSYRSALYTEGLDSKGAFVFFSSNNRFTISKSWSAELSGRYNSKITSSQFTLGARGSINISIQKKILKDQGTLRLIANDIFYMGINNGVINNLQLTDATWKNKPDSRYVAIAFSYSFGKMFQSKSQERSGAESEQSRVKG
ncbi:outer membrane beta-barrel protein [Flavobacterium pallidum]|uniref:TonB-dependent receptor n=1 Tax=Flavobacterium pallidum TaxID=2172098 RepID=A0A2S1SHW5_9FLAO|nr:outer membrane beta-barrel protein [Flavobacterium pallidum]AWI25990.1 TonB-dependent receptor [Flavobacterium pallidum]